MSLSPRQIENTKRELKENFDKAGLSIHTVAADLGTTDRYIEQLMRLDPIRLEDTWILKNYLIEKVKEKGEKPTKFTALAGNYHLIWFLSSRYIDGGKITTVK